MTTEASFNADRLAQSLSRNALTPGTARTIARPYATCYNCDHKLGDGLSGGKVVSKNVDFTVVCPDCEARQRVSVEEKIWGITAPDSDLIPGMADTFDLEDGSVLYLNPWHVSVVSLED